MQLCKGAGEASPRAANARLRARNVVPGVFPHLQVPVFAAGFEERHPNRPSDTQQHLCLSPSMRDFAKRELFPTAWVPGSACTPGAGRYPRSADPTSMSCFVLLCGEEERGGRGRGGRGRRCSALACIPARGFPAHPFSAPTVVTKEISTVQLGTLGQALPLERFKKQNAAMSLKTLERSGEFLCRCLFHAGGVGAECRDWGRDLFHCLTSKRWAVFSFFMEVLLNPRQGRSFVMKGKTGV